jgi:glycosyltransferase involved in cell wall biosynthesis
MKLSIVVVFHDMSREAARTLYSLSPTYQRGVEAGDYEVIAIDNGSSHPLDPSDVAQHGANFRYHFHATDSVSPVAAVNLGAAMARGAALAVIVDGARMASPGLIRQTLMALRVHPATFVCALAWHIGPDIQPRLIQHGYDQDLEDRLLAAVDWQRDGYQLFAISTIAPSSKSGFLGSFPTECSWFCLPRERYAEIGGFDPAFTSPGGGLCNHEFRDRAVTHPGMVSVVLLGEGVFHQVHGGASTNAPPDSRPHRRFHAEYKAIFGKPLVSRVPHETIYFGSLPDAARRYLLM